jgi:hypothetical protein
LIPSGVEVFLA